MAQELFSLFDPSEEIDITYRHLPHWQQTGKSYFITFRTEDSLPRAVVEAWYQARNVWLKNHDIDPAGPTWRQAL